MVKNWDSVKSIIHRLYVTQEQSLDEVRDVMIRQYNFVASDRAYKNKIPEWGWRTNQIAGGRIATIRRRPRRRRVNTTTNSQRVVSHDVGASVAVVRDSEFRALDPTVSSGQLRSSDSSNPWDTPGSFQLGAVGQNYLPETHEAEHGFEVSLQNTPSRSELDAINQQDILGRTLLHRMVTTGELNNVKDALVNGARVDVEDNDGNQPLHLAVIGNYPHIIRYLLKHGARLNAQGSDGKTPVHLAVGLPAALRTLLGAHPKLSTSDNDGDTALHVALRRVPSERPRDGGVIEKLLRRGANVNAMNHAGVTPFHMAMKKPEYCHSSLFLEHDPDINLLTHAGESSFAIFLNNIGTFNGGWSEQILMFLQKGADPNTQVSNEESLLYFVLNNGDILWYHKSYDIALQLCKTANIHTPSVTGDLPIHCIMRLGTNFVGADLTHLKLAEALLYRGSDPNQSNGKGERPLQILLSKNVGFQSAACLNVKIALENLVDHGADPMLVDSSGDLPICIAYRQTKNDNRDEVVKILTDAFIARSEHINEGNKSPSIPIWWQKYRAFRLQRYWTSEATRLFESASSGVATGIPQDLTRDLPKLLISFAAEAILQAAKTSLSNEGIDIHSVVESYNVVNILRGCKNMGIDMDVKWYYFLLDNLP